MDHADWLRVGLVRQDRVSDPPTAFEARVRGELEPAWRLASVILGSALDAEDAVAEAALRAWRNRRSLRDGDRFAAWFGRIVVNVCRDRLRVQRRLPRIDVLIDDEIRTADDFRDDVHRRDTLGRAFELLPPDDRIVLVLRFWLDLPVESIATQLDIPVGTAKSRLHHATQRLRAEIRESEARDDER